MRTWSFSQAAEEDLDSAAAYLTEQTGNTRYGDELIDAVAALGARLIDNPLLGHSRPELEPGLRSFPVAGYMIFYRVSGEHVEIARILHQRRDLTRIFGRKTQRRPRRPG